MAKTLLGVSEDMTWDAYFKEAAKKSLIQITMLKKGAAEKGITWNDDMQKELTPPWTPWSPTPSPPARARRVPQAALRQQHDQEEIFKGILKDTIIASHYQQDYIDSLQYTDEELQKYYEENKNSFDVANYEMITFNGAAASHQGRRWQHRPAHSRRRAPPPRRRPRTPPPRAGDRQGRHPA